MHKVNDDCEDGSNTLQLSLVRQFQGLQLNIRIFFWDPRCTFPLSDNTIATVAAQRIFEHRNSILLPKNESAWTIAVSSWYWKRNKVFLDKTNLHSRTVRAKCTPEHSKNRLWESVTNQTAQHFAICDIFFRAIIISRKRKIKLVLDKTDVGFLNSRPL